MIKSDESMVIASVPGEPGLNLTMWSAALMMGTLTHFRESDEVSLPLSKSKSSLEKSRKKNP